MYIKVNGQDLVLTEVSVKRPYDLESVLQGVPELQAQPYATISVIPLGEVLLHVTVSGVDYYYPLINVAATVACNDETWPITHPGAFVEIIGQQQ